MKGVKYDYERARILGVESYHALTNRAIVSYFQQHTWDGFDCRRPGVGSGVEKYKRKLYVVLREGSRTIAVYQVENHNYLKSLKRWPSALGRTPVLSKKESPLNLLMADFKPIGDCRPSELSALARYFERVGRDALRHAGEVRAKIKRRVINTNAA